jgi:GrpB-like predicted nucleotidyltransferase (UPF0157 family)
MIVIHAYKATWPAEFDAIRDHLASVLGERAKDIAHIGSTAVPELGAKDVIDIQIGVESLDSAIASELTAAGYEFAAEHSSDHVPEGATGSAQDWKKLHFRGQSGLRPCHIHIRVQGSPNYRYALLFRDYLRAHPETRMTIEVIKRELSRLHGNDADAYYAIKDPVYDLIWQAANEWARNSGWHHESAPVDSALVPDRIVRGP